LARNGSGLQVYDHGMIGKRHRERNVDSGIQVQLEDGSGSIRQSWEDNWSVAYVGYHWE